VLMNACVNYEGCSASDEYAKHICGFLIHDVFCRCTSAAVVVEI